MHALLVFTSAFGLAAAAPSVLTPVKRDACSPLPSGTGPVPFPDTASNFLNGPTPTAVVPSPNDLRADGYGAPFTGQKCAVSGPNYKGFTTIPRFDPKLCAALCNQDSTCAAFNIYIERAPTVEPDQTSCPNPPSNTYYRCSFWGSTIDLSQCTNTGQYRASFQVAIVGSYAYTKLPNSNSFAGPWSTNSNENCTITRPGAGSLIYTLDGGASPPPAAVAYRNYFTLSNGAQIYFQAQYQYTGAQSCRILLNGDGQGMNKGRGEIRTYFSGARINVTLACSGAESAGQVALSDMQTADTSHGYQFIEYL